MIARRAVARVVVYAVVCVEPRVDDRHRQGVVEPELAPTVGHRRAAFDIIEDASRLPLARCCCSVLLRRDKALKGSSGSATGGIRRRRRRPTNKLCALGRRPALQKFFLKLCVVPLCRGNKASDALPLSPSYSPGGSLGFIHHDALLLKGKECCLHQIRGDIPTPGAEVRREATTTLIPRDPCRACSSEDASSNVEATATTSTRDPGF